MTETTGWRGPRKNDEGRDFGRLLNELREIKQRLAAVERGAPLRSAGIRLTQDGMTIDRSLDVDGSLTTTGASTIGGTLDVGAATTITGNLDVTGDAEFSGDTTIGGNAAITGTLSLPAGIIDNDALATPLVWRSVINNGTDPSINNSSETTAVSASMTVPTGFSYAFVVVTSQVGLINPQSTEQSVGARAYIDFPDQSYWSGRSYTKALSNADVALYPTTQGGRAVSGGSTVSVEITLIGGPGSTWGTTSGFVTINAYMLLTR